jgi:hypothetical protein
MEDAFDEPGSHFIPVQEELVIHVTFQISEKTEFKASKYVVRFWMESLRAG